MQANRIRLESSYCTFGAKPSNNKIFQSPSARVQGPSLANLKRGILGKSTNHSKTLFMRTVNTKPPECGDVFSAIDQSGRRTWYGERHIVVIGG